MRVLVLEAVKDREGADDLAELLEQNSVPLLQVLYLPHDVSSAVATWGLGESRQRDAEHWVAERQAKWQRAAGLLLELYSSLGCLAEPVSSCRLVSCSRARAAVMAEAEAFTGLHPLPLPVPSHSVTCTADARWLAYPGRYLAALKADGVRHLLITTATGQPFLLNRPPRGLPPCTVLDGELVLHGGGAQPLFLVFDALCVAGSPVWQLPLTARLQHLDSLDLTTASLLQLKAAAERCGFPANGVVFSPCAMSCVLGQAELLIKWQPPGRVGVDLLGSHARSLPKPSWKSSRGLGHRNVDLKIKVDGSLVIAFLWQGQLLDVVRPAHDGSGLPGYQPSPAMAQTFAKAWPKGPLAGCLAPGPKLACTAIQTPHLFELVLAALDGSSAVKAMSVCWTWCQLVRGWPGLVAAVEQSKETSANSYGSADFDDTRHSCDYDYCGSDDDDDYLNRMSTHGYGSS
ncbi:SET domain containing [Haematococcus lacustris]|uniref:SET domain containing n=1 Tax=Haematococcus lacustris TaxID=44745 RepID=A0A6A0A9L8_HAELA|nr:SET domain containing [Haematococcus lacustris]